MGANHTSCDEYSRTATAAPLRAQLLPPLPQNLPTELRAGRHFVAWDLVTRSGERGQKLTKMPYRAVGAPIRTPASSTDPNTWATLQEALSACQKHGYTGIGRVLVRDDGITFIDLDHCRDPHTGGIQEWAMDIVRSINSYTEVWPSGTGLHIFIRGTLPDSMHRRRKGSIEMYCDARFATLTGHHLEGTPQTLEERSARIAKLYDRVFGEGQHNRPLSREASAAGNGHAASETFSDEEIVRLASRAANGGKFRALWSGDRSDYPSQSEADLALSSMLAFYTQDADQIERLVGQSELGQRAKWSERRDYAGRTIAKALSGQTEHYVPRHCARGNGRGEPPKSAKNAKDASSKTMAPLDTTGTLRGRDFSQGRVLLSEVKPVKLRHLWKGWIPLGKAGELLGDGGLGKGTLLCDLAARITRHLPMPGEELCDLEGPRGVVWYTAEDMLDDTLVPCLMAAGADRTKIAGRQFVPDGREGAGGMRLPDLSRDLDCLEDDIKLVDAAPVILDPVIAFFPASADSHKDQSVRGVMAPLGLLADRTGATILAVRHLNKATNAGAVFRGGGSIAFTAGARFSLVVAKDPADETGQRRVLAVNKTNTYKETTALAYQLVNDEEYEVGKVDWLGPTDYSANTLLATSPDRLTGEELSKVEEAVKFLEKTLAHGPRKVVEVKNEAIGLSLSERTLLRAKNKLGVVSDKVEYGKEGYWTWALPASSADGNAGGSAEGNGAGEGSNAGASGADDVISVEI